MQRERIPDAELEVLACLGRFGSATVRQVREAMHAYRPLAHGSVVTLLKRLEERGLVSRSKGPVGKAFVYEATPGAAAALRRRVSRTRERLFDGDSVALVASLFETRRPDAAELDELQRLLDRLKAHRQERGR